MSFSSSTQLCNSRIETQQSRNCVSVLQPEMLEQWRWTEVVQQKRKMSQNVSQSWAEFDTFYITHSLFSFSVNIQIIAALSSRLFTNLLYNVSLLHGRRVLILTYEISVVCLRWCLNSTTSIWVWSYFWHCNLNVFRLHSVAALQSLFYLPVAPQGQCMPSYLKWSDASFCTETQK